MKQKDWRGVVAVGLLVALAVLLTPPAGMAAVVPSQMTAPAGQATLAPETVAAERALVKAKLMDFGLTDVQAQSRMVLLTDQEVHALAADLDSIKAGAAGRSFTTTEVLLMVILVVLLVN